MSIEKNLERIAVALEDLAAAAITPSVVNNTAAETPVQLTPEEVAAEIADAKAAAKPPKRRKPKSTPSPEAATEVTVDDVREALRLFLKDNEASAAAVILKEFGSPSVTALDPQHYAVVISRLAA